MILQTSCIFLLGDQQFHIWALLNFLGCLLSGPRDLLTYKLSVSSNMGTPPISFTVKTKASNVLNCSAISMPSFRTPFTTFHQTIQPPLLLLMSLKYIWGLLLRLFLLAFYTGFQLYRNNWGSFFFTSDFNIEFHILKSLSSLCLPELC